MGYIFDGEVIAKQGGVKAPLSPPGVLPRLIAVVLFAIAAVLGLPIAALAAMSLVSGALRLLVLAALASTFVLWCGWFGTALWSGREKPHWLIVLTMLIVSLACFLLVLLLIIVWVVTAISLP